MAGHSSVWLSVQGATLARRLGYPATVSVAHTVGKFRDDARFEVVLTEQGCWLVLKVQLAFAVSKILYLLRAQQCHSFITPAHMTPTISWV